VTVPTEGDTDHVTAVLLEPVTVAVNCCAWLTLSDADVGETEIPTDVPLL
jgi:hypothetical protein